MITCALFTVLIALEWNNCRLREQRTLFVFMLTTTVLYAGHYVFFNHVVHVVPFMDVVYVAANLAVYPLYLIYIIRLTARWKSWYYWGFLPAFLAALACGISLFTMSDEESSLFTEQYLYHNLTEGLTGTALLLAWIHIVCKIVFAIEVIITIVVGVQLIRRYDNAVNQFYADTDDKSMRNIKSIFYLIVIASVMSFVANVIGRYRFTNATYLLAFPSIAFTILLFAIGYLGLRYIELSISSPICNSSGAIVAVLTFITAGISEDLPPIALVAVALVCIGVVGLGFVEANEDEELRRARQDASNRHYAKSWIAILIPVIYCLLDALGTFADSRVLEVLDEDSANVAYELTFLMMGVCWA